MARKEEIVKLLQRKLGIELLDPIFSIHQIIANWIISYHFGLNPEMVLSRISITHILSDNQWLLSSKYSYNEKAIFMQFTSFFHQNKSF